MRKEENKAYSYDYKEIHGKGEKMSFLLDCYENFGWKIDRRLVAEEANSGNGLRMESTILKRDRKIANKVELTRLQRNFEACLVQIEKMELAKITLGQAVSIAVGIIGTAFLAGGVMVITMTHIHWILGVLLSIPGFAGWILPIFLYRKLVNMKTEELSPLIEKKYDEIYELCEKGSKLQYN